jgi:hypothetical protein
MSTLHKTSFLHDKWQLSAAIVNNQQERKQAHSGQAAGVSMSLLAALQLSFISHHHAIHLGASITIK